MGYIVDEFDSSKLLLGAINVLLQTVNELPIESDTDLLNSTTGQLAETTINEVKKVVLSEGWDINTDYGFPMPPDVGGIIAVPANVLDIIVSNGNDIIMRDWKLYDRKNFTFIFSEPVNCDIVWNMDFNSLTHPIRHYITIRSALVFQSRLIGDQASFTYTSKDMEDAYNNAKYSDGRTGKYNMLTSVYGSSNMGTR